MLRRLIALAALSLAPLAAPAQEQDFSKVEIKVSALGGGVYLLQGAGGNIGASIGADGSVLVDDEFAPLADKIGAALSAAGATRPVRFIILTHYHPDHVGGNLPFASAGATIISHDNLRASLARGGAASERWTPAPARAWRASSRATRGTRRC